MPDTALADQLVGTGPEVVSIGDANRVARIGEAVRDAYLAVQNLRRSMTRRELIAC